MRFVNRSGFQMIVVNASNFEQRFADKFSRGLCLNFACSPMALQVMEFRKEGCGWWNTFLLLAPIIVFPIYFAVQLNFSVVPTL